MYLNMDVSGTLESLKVTKQIEKHKISQPIYGGNCHNKIIFTKPQVSPFPLPNISGIMIT